MTDMVHPVAAPTPPSAPDVPLTRREIMFGGLFAVVGAAAYLRRPQTHVVGLPDGNLEKAIPRRAGAWQVAPDEGFIMPPEDEQKAASVYETQLTRSYLDAGGIPVMLLIAYDRSQSGMLMIHRPESCYPGSGFDITAIRDVDVPLAPGLTANGRFLSTERGTRIEQVLYWTRLGNGFPASWDAQRKSIAMQNLQGYIPDGALVRLSMITSDADVALATMQRFATTLFAASGKPGRGLLAGPVNA